MSSSTNKPVIDDRMLKHLDEIMGRDVTLLLIKQFLHYAPQQLLELHQSLLSADKETARRKAHQLKGESLQIGATQFGKFCEQMELLAYNNELEAALEYWVKIKTEWEQVDSALQRICEHE